MCAGNETASADMEIDGRRGRVPADGGLSGFEQIENVFVVAQFADHISVVDRRGELVDDDRRFCVVNGKVFGFDLGLLIDGGGGRGGGHGRVLGLKGGCCCPGSGRCGEWR